MENKELQVNGCGGFPTSVISEAIAKGTDLQQLKEFYELQQQWEANEARKAYNKAMAQFKSNPPKIEKDRKVGYSTSKGNVGYSHASLYNIVEKTTAELSKYGLSASWRVQQNGKVIVTCRISHELGHYEETSICADVDNSGSKNPIQAIGSTITYLSRYALLSILGLATFEDTDGVTPEDKIDAGKVDILNKLIQETGIDVPKFLQFLNVEAIEELPASSFSKAKLALEQKKRGGK